MNIDITTLIFYFFSCLTLFSSTMVIISQNPVRAALFLVLAFFTSAGLWLLMEAEFLALILILVYVGAVMTLFLFVLMTLQMEVTKLRLSLALPVGVAIVSLLTGLMVRVINPVMLQSHIGLSHGIDYSNTQTLGNVLYTQYAYPFEIAGVILFVAIIAVISLGLKEQRNRKLQKIEQQLAVNPKDRIRILKMPVEKRTFMKREI